MSNSQMTLTSRSGSLPTAFSSLSALGATVKHDRAAGVECNPQEMQSFVYLFCLNSRLLTNVHCDCMWVNLYILHSFIHSFIFFIFHRSYIQDMENVMFIILIVTETYI